MYDKINNYVGFLKLNPPPESSEIKYSKNKQQKCETVNTADI